jgi:uncharacterized protein (TIGR00251 family)
MIDIKTVQGGVRLMVRVQPRSSKNQVSGELDGCLKIKLTAPPVEGEANQALIKFLSGFLGIPRQDIMIVRGETTHNKLIEISGVDEKWLRTRLEPL